MEVGCGRGIEHGFDHEDELVARFPAVNDRWRVFSVWRDIAHLTDERIAHAIHRDPYFVAVMDRANARFWNKRTHLDILRRQQRDHWFTGCDPFALTVERVINQTCLRRRLPLLQKTPVCLSKSSLVLISRRTSAIQILGGGRTGVEKFVLARVFRFRKHERRLDLLARSLLRGFIQSEERVTGFHLIASSHVQRFQRPGERRRDINEFTFDITLETIFRWVTATANQKKQYQRASGAH